jgi:hypothetical protein
VAQSAYFIVAYRNQYEEDLKHQMTIKRELWKKMKKLNKKNIN